MTNRIALVAVSVFGLTMVAPAKPPAKGKQATQKPASQAPAGMSAAAADRVKAATAYVEGKRGSGSAFVVQPNVLMTNAHVIVLESIDDIRIKFVSENGSTKTHKVKLLAFDKARDIAMLRVIDGNLDREPLKINAALDPGRRPAVYIVGNPAQEIAGHSTINSIAPASVAEKVSMLDNMPFLELKVGVSGDEIVAGPGNSGGPVVDSEGRVVGILTAGVIDTRSRKPTAKMFCIPGDAVQKALDALGRPDQWDERSKAAIDRHSFLQHATNAYVNAQIARLVLDARKSLWENAGASFFLRDNPADKDAKLIEVFEKCDKSLQDQMAKISRDAKDGTMAGDPDKKRLTDAKDLLVTARATLVKKVKDVRSPTAVARCNKSIQDSIDILKKITDKLGVTSDEVNAIALAVLRDAGVEFGK